MAKSHDFYHFHDIIVKRAEEVLGKETRAAKKPWIDVETVELMVQKGKYTNAKYKQGKTQHKRLRSEVQRRCRKNAEKRELAG